MSTPAGPTPPGVRPPPDPKLVKDAWDAVARAGYADYWSPRFRPLIEKAVERFDPPPRGPLVVPGCGPGDELLLLAQKFPGRATFATDPSPEMVSLALGRVREAGLSSVLVSSGMAEEVSSVVHQAAGIFSAFTLQLVGDPVACLLDWAHALRPGGVIVAVFWPMPSPESVYGRLLAATIAVTGEGPRDWAPQALESFAHAGLTLVSDERLTEHMGHASPDELFSAIVDRGAFQTLLRRKGPDALAAIRARWVTSHGLEKAAPGDPRGAWICASEARLWKLVKTAEPLGGSH